MEDPLADGGPLISAAALGKLRLVRLLLEGGAQVNGRNPRGETPLLAACEALRGEPAGPQALKLITYLIRNKADPNAQDRSGRTPLMYACMRRAGAQVASALLSAGADPSVEDFSGASALVYAVNAQHQPTLQVLMDACRANGRDIIIIATETGGSGGPVTRRYLNVPPTPDTSPVSCMSPSDIVLKTASPSSPGAENVFNFRGTGKGGGGRFPPCDPGSVDWPGLSPPRQRMLSEPWLAVHHLDRLHRAYEEGLKERESREEEEEEAAREEQRRGKKTAAQDGERGSGRGRDSHFCHRRAPERPPSGGSTSDAATGSLSSVDAIAPGGRARRNTLPSLSLVPPLHLPPLVPPPDAHLKVAPAKSTALASHPHPRPHPRPPPLPFSSAWRSVRSGPLPPLTPSPPATSSVARPPPASLCGERGTRAGRRHSSQLEQIGREEVDGGGGGGGGGGGTRPSGAARASGVTKPARRSQEEALIHVFCL